MITKVDAIKFAVEKLKENNIPDFKISSEYILAVALKKNYEDLISVDKLTDKEYKRYLKLIDKRCKHVPLDKIIGYVEFYNLKIPYNKNILSPRVETELLAERVIKDLEKVKNVEGLKVLDMCTGSGCLGLAIAKHIDSSVTLSDISKKAIKLAEKNGKYNYISSDVNYVISDLFDNIIDKYDIIVCNPPYIKTSDLAKLEIEVRDFDPILALDGGKDGLDFYRKIIKSAPEYLTTKNNLGYIYFEIGVDQSETICKMLEKDFVNIKVIKDYSKIDRFIIAKKREKDA